MNKAEFTDLIKNPDKLGSEHIDTLKKIVADYPYFSTAHILLAKALLNTKHYEYEKQLKTTALSVGDRSILHQFLSDNSLEIETENNHFNVPLELKVEKVSKPDFEIGKEEQEALLNEAQEIIANGITTENITETVEEKIEDIITPNHSNITEIETESVVENVTENIDVIEPDFSTEIEQTKAEIEPPIAHFIEEKEEDIIIDSNLNEPIIEEVLVVKNDIEELELTTNDQLNTEQGTSVENTIESSVENLAQEIEEHITEIPEPTNNETNYQLTETEGTLVRFKLDDNFLPDFDEASLFADEQEIETITKSVLPIVNSTTEIVKDIPVESIPTIDEIVEEQNLQPISEHIDSVEETIIENEIISLNENKEVIETEEITFIHEQETEIPVVIEPSVTLENLLDAVNTTETTEETEKIVSIKETEIDIIEQIAQPETIDTFTAETDNISEVETFNETESKNSEIDKNFDNQSIEEITNDDSNKVESHNFIEWLAAKNKSEVHLSEFEVKSSSSKNSFEIENDDFVEKINQILKTKADFELSRNIAHGIQSAHDGMATFERKTAVIEIPETEEEPIENEVENSVDDIIETPNSTDDEVFDEIEAFKTHTPIIGAVEANIVDTEPQVEKEVAIENHFIEEIYTGQVESILPDFDALQNADSIAEEENTQQEIIAVSADNETNETAIEAEETPAIDDEKEEVEEVKKFDIPPIKEADFDELQNAELKVEEENTKQELIAVSADNETNETIIEVEETLTIDDEKEEVEEVQKFDIAPINETDFDAFFFFFYEPIVIEKQAVKAEVEAPKVVAKNTTLDNSKLAVESILDKFMRENPSITRPKSEFFNPANVAKQSVEEKDEIVSETLAGIYLKQGLIKKAISTYEKLSLIYPHKITYFAALINQLKTEHNIN